jgi:hypothetical protein
VQASVSPDAPLIQVSAGTGDAVGAAALANAVAGELVSYGNARSADTGVRLASFSQALPPSAPSSPVPFLDVLVGAAAGLLLGGLATLGATTRTPGPAAPLPPPHRPSGRPRNRPPERSGGSGEDGGGEIVSFGEARQEAGR